MNNRNCRIRLGRIKRCFRICVFVLIGLEILTGVALADPLPSWNAGQTRQAIIKFVQRRPIAAFGNSDSDHQMLQWAAAGEEQRFMLLVHHTDAEREWAYDNNLNHFEICDLDFAFWIEA
jgi:hypothetical protein